LLDAGGAEARSPKPMDFLVALNDLAYLLSR